MQVVGTVVAFGAAPLRDAARLDATALSCEVLSDDFRVIKQAQGGSLLLLLCAEADDPALAAASKAARILRRRGGGKSTTLRGRWRSGRRKPASSSPVPKSAPTTVRAFWPPRSSRFLRAAPAAAARTRPCSALDRSRRRGRPRSRPRGCDRRSRSPSRTCCRRS